MAETTHYLIVGEDDGLPRGMVDIDRLQSDATVLMYRLAAVAGDDAALERVSQDWLRTADLDSVGFTAVAALSLLARCVVAPLLEVLDRAAPGHDFRSALAEARDYAEATLTAEGGGAA